MEEKAMMVCLGILFAVGMVYTIWGGLYFLS